MNADSPGAGYVVASGGRVEFQAPAPEASYKTLTLQTLDGNGVFVPNNSTSPPAERSVAGHRSC